MKKALLFLSLLVIASTSVFAQKKKVAVVTFYVDKNINFSGLNENAALAGAVASLAEDPNFDLNSALNQFHDAFFGELAKSMPFELIDEGIVINNEAYKSYDNIGTDAADEDKKLFQHYIAYEGYKPLIEVAKVSNDKYRAELQMLEIFGDEVDGVMFVRLDYSFIQKLAVGGTGTAGIAAWTRIKLWNKDGDKVFAKNEQGTSKKSVPIAGGIPVMKPAKIQDLCESATEKLISDLKKKLPKTVKKIDKKL
jgi:hypothetical protein